jgi:hypothetical protein
MSKRRKIASPAEERQEDKTNVRVGKAEKEDAENESRKLNTT